MDLSFTTLHTLSLYLSISYGELEQGELQGVNTTRL